MIHECKVQCHTVNIEEAELLGIEDIGKWLPFIIDLDMVYGAKMATDEIDDDLFNCTTVYTEVGDTYIINTPFTKFSKLLLDHKTKKNDGRSKTTS